MSSAAASVTQQARAKAATLGGIAEQKRFYFDLMSWALEQMNRLDRQQRGLRQEISDDLAFARHIERAESSGIMCEGARPVGTSRR